MEYLFKNNAIGHLNTSIGTSDTVINLESGDGDDFPSPAANQGFHIVVEQGSKYEWMLCTSRTGEALTVTRGASPQSFDDGARVENRLHGDALAQFIQKGDFRTVTADPDGSLAAIYSGEEVYNQTTAVWWKHCTGTVWKAMNT